MWSELKTLLHNVMTEWLNVGTDIETTQSIDEYISSIDCVITVCAYVPYITFAQYKYRLN